MARPSKALISREKTAEVALKIIDVEGLEALSLERLARELGVRAPSLYHHFGDKADILAEVALLMYLDTPVPRMPPAEAWREWHMKMSMNRYRSILRHYRAAPLLFTFRPRHVVLPVYERSAKIMANAGVPEEFQIIVMDGLEKLTFGSALYTAAAIEDDVAVFPEFDADRYRFVAAAISSDYAGGGDTFPFTLWSFLRGVPDESSGHVPELPDLKALDILADSR